MPKRSTPTDLIQFSSYAIKSIEAGTQVDAIYFDFAKAFDRVSGPILVRKLREGTEMPSSVIRWVESYLYGYGRRQCVTTGNALSEPFSVSSGVGQGSHSGPSLFCFFIDDLAQIVLAFILHMLFAYDLKIFAAIYSG